MKLEFAPRMHEHNLNSESERYVWHQTSWFPWLPGPFFKKSLGRKEVDRMGGTFERGGRASTEGPGASEA